MVVDAIARSEGIDMRKLEKSAAVGRGELAGRKVLLAKPITVMVGWGGAVVSACVGGGRNVWGDTVVCGRPVCDLTSLRSHRHTPRCHATHHNAEQQRRQRGGAGEILQGEGAAPGASAAMPDECAPC